MGINIKSKFKMHHQHNRRELLLVSLIFGVMLFFSSLVSVFNTISPFVSGASNKVVSNETELRAAVNSAVVPTTIVLNTNISIKDPLVILKDKDITLTSVDGMVCSLIGIVNTWDVIGVDGVLTLDGIIVTHAKGVTGRGVDVNKGGTFIMLNGVISGNTVQNYGGGVWNEGTFVMSGGVIDNNTATYYGGGVYVKTGSFNMTDGMIFGNTADYGGGVYTCSDFTMNNGLIVNNTAMYGGGVYVATDGLFDLSGNAGISCNEASKNGGGIWITDNNSVTDFEKLTVGVGVAFKDNRASTAYNRSSIHDDVYIKQIKGVSWSAHFTQGYNNYDISYTYGTSIPFYMVSVQDSYVTSTGAGSYMTGESVTVNAGTRNGYTFNGWIVNEVSMTLPNSATATFTMPAHNVALTATWNPISLNNDSVSNDNSSNSVNNSSLHNSNNRSPTVWVEQPNALLVVVALGLVAGVTAIVLFVYFQKIDT